MNRFCKASRSQETQDKVRRKHTKSHEITRMRFEMKQTTKQMELHPRGWLAGLCSVAMIVGLAPAGVAQQAGNGPRVVSASQTTSAVTARLTASAALPVAEEKEEVTTPKKPGNEGLKIHGHWKIVSRNADGTIAKTYEFDNALISGGNGDFILASLLSGAASLGEWSILLKGTGFCGYSCQLQNNATGTDYFGFVCTLPTGVPGGISECFSGLTTSVVVGSNTGSTSTQSQLIFSGTFTPTAAGSISLVQTNASFCYVGSPTASPTGTFTPTPSTVSPANCQIAPIGGTTNVQASGFTGTGLATPFSFTAGQAVQVSVTLSFS
jgi:hypothetical protein